MNYSIDYLINSFPVGSAVGPGPDRLGFGLGGEPGWWGVGGGGRGNFMYLYHNFSLVN